MPPRAPTFSFPAAGRLRGSLAALFLAVLAIGNIHHSLGDNGSLRKPIHKRSSEGLDLNLLDSLRPLRRTKRRWVITTLELQEEGKGPFPTLVGELFNDVSYNATIKYLISGPGVDEYPEAGMFSIEDDANGHVYVHRPIDRESTPSFTIRFDVANRMTGEILDKSLLFTVRIEDINDNAPEFPKKEFHVSIKENHLRDEPVFNITAFDKDEKGTANSRVAYSLVSQTPRPEEPVFIVDYFSGLIRISGCSDYETTRTFQLLVKATDHGNPQLSSTATVNIALEDSNNNIPVFTQENYQLDVPEGKIEHDVLRLGVEDKDSPGTLAWKAKYKILRGNEGKNFLIETDPGTNEGVLSIIKPLAYNSTSKRRLVISVENEEPFFTCHRGQVRNSPAPLKETSVNINVMDRNDAPQFNPPILVLRQEEEVKPGTFLVRYTAMDPDASPNVIRYKVVSDPDGWVAIDESSGIVTTVKKLDRESPSVNNSGYTIVIHAIDNGVPPLTGTGTIQLHLLDNNDHAPLLVTSSLEVCDGKEKGPFVIRAEDKDSDLYSGPFIFELDETSDTVKNSWKLGKNFDESAQLLMLRSLPQGHYSVPLKIFDRQGFSQAQTLHVRVCHCVDGITCEQAMKSASVSLGGGAIGAIVAAFLLLILCAGLLLWCSCRSETEKGPVYYIPYETGKQTLIHYNDESQHVLSQGMPDLGNHTTPFLLYEQMSKKKSHTVKDIPDVGNRTTPPLSYEHISKEKTHMVKDDHTVMQAKSTGDHDHPNGMRTFPPAIPEEMQPMPVWHQVRENTATLYSLINNINWKKPHDRIVETVDRTLNQKLYHMTNVEDNITSDLPHTYAEEGRLDTSESYWSMPVADDDVNSLPPDFLDTLGPKLASLGKICSK